MEKAKRSRRQPACAVPAAGGGVGDLIKKCAAAACWGLDMGPPSPQALLSCLTSTEPGFSESPALMENKFRELEWSH